jgi:hypothetical protein
VQVSASPQTVKIGDSVTIEVGALNKGDAGGQQTISGNWGSLTFDLDPGQTARKSFTVTPSEPGKHSVTVGRHTVTFRVKDPVLTTKPVNDPEVVDEIRSDKTGKLKRPNNFEGELPGPDPGGQQDKPQTNPDPSTGDSSVTVGGKSIDATTAAALVVTGLVIWGVL